MKTLNFSFFKHLLLFVAPLTVCMVLYQNLTSMAVASELPSVNDNIYVLSIADDHAFKTQISELIEARFQKYREIGITTLRVEFGWRDLEKTEGNWSNPVFLEYLKLAQNHGFRFKMSVGTFDSPPLWFLQNNPQYRIYDKTNTYSKNSLNYWHPNLLALMQNKLNQVMNRLRNNDLLRSIDIVIVPLGPASEALYPPTWTVGDSVTNERFWFYGSQARTSFKNYMIEEYTTIGAANTAWGTSYTSWSQVVIPEPGTQTGKYWEDVLIWYRDVKREFIEAQIQIYKNTMSLYFTNAGLPQPQLMLLAPYHYTQSMWDAAVSSGDGSEQIRLMADADFMVDIAHEKACVLQYTGLPELNEILYYQNYMSVNNKPVKLHGETTGGIVDPYQFTASVSSVKSQNLAGFDYVSTGGIYEADGVTQKPLYPYVISGFSYLYEKGTKPIDYGLGQLVLQQNQFITIGPLKLVMQSTGNLVLYRGTTALWWTSTQTLACENICQAVFQNDGNFVIYNGTTPIWNSQTDMPQSGFVASKLRLSTTIPYLQILSADGDVIWASSYDFESLGLSAGRFVRVAQGQSFRFLTLTNDGVLGVYSGYPAYFFNKIWSTNATSSCTLGCNAYFQTDGNLVTYNGVTPYWYTGTAGTGALLRLGTSSPLQLLNSQGAVIWDALVNP